MRNISALRLLLVAVLIVSVQSVSGQWHSELNYGTAFPTSKFQEFVPSTAWWNWQFQTRKQINKRYELGGAVAWNYFSNDFGLKTITGEGFALTSNVTSFTNILSFKMVNQYNLAENQEAIPFVRLGLGAAYQNQQQEIGLYTINNNGWQMLLNPEVGVRIELNYFLGLTLSGGYNFLPESSGLVPTSFWNLNLGLTWIRF